MELVADILSNPPTDGDNYSNIKKTLISRCQDSEEKKLDALLNKVDIGDMKPSELFRHMVTLAGNMSFVNQQLLQKLWLGKLPKTIQPCIIAIEGTHTQEQTFEIADKIHDSSARANVSAFEREPDVSNDSIQSLLKTLCEKLDRLGSNPGTSQYRQSRPRSRTPARGRDRSKSRNRELCWYHHKFGEKPNNSISSTSSLKN